MNRKMTNQYGFRRTGFIKSLFVGVAIALGAIGGVVLLTGMNAYADSKHTDTLCGNNALCQSIEGKEFNLIKYSSMGSELVVLYDKSKVGEIIPAIPEVSYIKARGTINHVIHVLSEHADYRDFRVRKGKKSTGWFKTEVIEGIYIVEPQYDKLSDNQTAEYSFSEKGGEIKLHVTPVSSLGSD